MAALAVQSSGLYTLSLWLREDGLRIDRLLLTTDTNYIPADFGPVETTRLTGTVTLSTTLERVIDDDYDALYRLTEASTSTGELYEYDPVGNLARSFDPNNIRTGYGEASEGFQNLQGLGLLTRLNEPECGTCQARLMPFSIYNFSMEILDWDKVRELAFRDRYRHREANWP